MKSSEVPQPNTTRNPLTPDCFTDHAINLLVMYTMLKFSVRTRHVG